MGTSRILLISGSLRSGSINTAVLRTARALTPLGCTAVIYEGLGRLPHYNPDDDVDPLDPTVADLRSSLEASNAVLVSTPEYAGALPGSFKNLLDWTVGAMVTYRKPFGWINPSTSPAGAVDAHRSLRTVLGYTNVDLVEAACVHIPVPRRAVGPDGLVDDPMMRQEIAAAMAALVRRVEAGSNDGEDRPT